MKFGKTILSTAVLLVSATAFAGGPCIKYMKACASKKGEEKMACMQAGMQGDSDSANVNACKEKMAAWSKHMHKKADHENSAPATTPTDTN